MGNIIRTVYLLIPFALTTLTAILLILVLADNQQTGALANAYFLRIDTSNIHNLNGAAVHSLEAYYDIGLWNYCSGPNIDSPPNICSPRQSAYYFNPLYVWNLQNSGVPELVPANWNDAISSYRDASKIVFVLYIIALVAALVTLLLGILTFFLSRVSNFFTIIAADVAALFTVAASATATAMFSILAGIIDARLHSYGVSAQFGTKLLAITWLACASSIVAGLLWSCGCCCGHERNHDAGRRRRSLNERPGYERVPSPFRPAGHADAVPLTEQQWPGRQQHPGPYQPGPQYPQHTAYEPYRAM